MTTKRRNNLLLAIVSGCAMLILPLLGVAIAAALGCSAEDLLKD